MFNQRKIKNDTCLICGSTLETQKKDCVLFKANWCEVKIISANNTWIYSDWNNFIKRQVEIYLFSKTNGCIKFYYENNEFGMRYQYVWALLLGFISEIHMISI